MVSATAGAGSARDKVNVGETERWVSLLGGSALAVYGLRGRTLPGLGLAAFGAALVQRGLTGHCALYRAMHLSTEPHGRIAAVGAGEGVKVVRVATIQRP